MWLVYPFYSISSGGYKLTVQMQQVTLMLLQLQVLTTTTALFLSIRPFSFSMLTVYYITPIIVSWFTNYLFGAVAVCMRRGREDVNCCYWILYMLVHVSLWVLAVYAMFQLENRFGIYLLVGVAIEILLDLVFCDLFVAYFYQSMFEDTKSPV
jgi:hypothetical protein